jgi:tetratricopeptide (TPR) repeat protein
VEHNDRQMSAYFNLGLLHGKGGNFTESAKNFEKALLLSPRNARIYDRLAWVYVLQKDYNRSLEMIEKALSVLPKETPFYKYMQDRKAKVMRAIEEAKR